MRLALVALSTFAGIAGCANEKREVEVTPVSSVQEAIKLIESHEGSPSDFALAIPDSLNDEVGITMAIVTDKILARGWWPNGFEQKEGYRVYRYKDKE